VDSAVKTKSDNSCAEGSELGRLLDELVFAIEVQRDQ
jgi:hypothetical protein